MKLFLGLLFLLLALGTAAETHTFHFNVSYVERNPDGVKPRRVIGVNNQWPIPTIRVKKHDRLEIYVTNSLGDKNTSLHFHGLFQNGSNAMDGPEMVTQCPIAPGYTFLYNFTVEDQIGTYWYHSHSGAQYSDGLRGLFIVEDDKPLPFEYDEEITLSLSDWYHDEYPDIMANFLNRYNPTGAEPIPQNALFNETRNSTWMVEPDTTYFVRIVNMGMFVSQYLSIEDHSFTVVEVDGVLVNPVETDSLYIAVAQRYGVLVHTKKSTAKNYRILNIIDRDMLDVQPEDLQLVSTNWLRYNKGDVPAKKADKYKQVVSQLNPVDDFKLSPLGSIDILPDYDHQIVLNFTMENLGNGVNYALFNGKTYVAPKVPTLMSVLSSGEFASNQLIYGSNTNSYVIQHDDTVEIVLNNMDAGKHPFHLHGHNFQVIARSPEGEDEENPIVYDPSNPDHNNFPRYPMTRDTVVVNANGFIVLRFQANNPGVWFFHCHVDWHLEQGLAITLVEAPFEIQAHQSLTSNHLQACAAAKMSAQGNAAGKFGDFEQEWLDLTGEPLQAAPLPPGFTNKGYFALALCTFIAVYGVYNIYKFGIEDVKNDNNEAVLRKLYDILDAHGELAESENFLVNTRESIE